MKRLTTYRLDYILCSTLAAEHGYPFKLKSGDRVCPPNPPMHPRTTDIIHELIDEIYRLREAAAAYKKKSKKAKKRKKRK